MSARTALAGTAAIIGIAINFAAAAQPDDYCTRYESQMAADTLYVVTTCPGKTHARCFVPVSSGTTLGRGITYRFLYKTPPSDIQNSLIVIKLKELAAQPLPAPAAVSLVRHQLSFGCYFKYWIVSREAIPSNPENDAAPTVAYDKYDQFNRYGFAPPPARTVLLKFHTNYFNGSACVTTRERVRRAQFLFTNQSNVVDFTASLGTRFELSTPPAIAAEINRYSRLQVVVANYKKRLQTSGCISFAGRGNGQSLEIDLSDLEEKARAQSDLDRFSQKTWAITTK